MLNEERLDIDDDTHIHVNWEDICEVEMLVENDEGLASIKDSEGTVLFSFYQFSVAFPQDIKDFEGSLLDY